MMKSKKALALLVAATAGVCAAQRGSAQTVITQYSFTSTSPAPTADAPGTTEAATTGTGTAQTIGMTNSYTYNNGEGPGAVDGSNLTSTSGTANSGFIETMLRVVGNSNKANAGAGMANGWNNSAPNYTQGVEFGANTTGYTPTQLTFDWYSTTQGVGNMQVQYTTDGVTWTNLGSDLIASSNDFYGGASGTPSNTISLTGLPAAATNDSLFGVRFVSVRPVVGDANYVAGGAAGDPGSDGNYASAAGGDYNNQSGNWRFDNVTISGNPSAVPEPASLGLLGLLGMGMLRRRSR